MLSSSKQTVVSSPSKYMVPSMNDISSTSSPLLQTFITNAIICLTNGMHNRQLCYTIWRKTCTLLDLKCCDFSQFDTDLSRIEERYRNMVVSGGYGAILLLRMQIMHELWTFNFPHHRAYTLNAMEIVRAKIQTDGNFASWPITDAVFIWPWLHVIAIDIDLNAGFREKVAFLRFIAEIIACSMCREHYLQHEEELINSLQITTCANTLLALHTFVNKTIATEDTDAPDDDNVKYIYNSGLVNSTFAVKYKRDYLQLKT